MSAAPGIYFVRIYIVYAFSKRETIWRKAVVIPRNKGKKAGKSEIIAQITGRYFLGKPFTLG